MTTSEERKCYLFAIVVNGKIIAAPAQNWWATDYEMRMQAAAYCTAARAFRKTAGVMVYEKRQNLWEAVHGCNMPCGDYSPCWLWPNEAKCLPLYA